MGGFEKIPSMERRTKGTKKKKNRLNEKRGGFEPYFRWEGPLQISSRRFARWTGVHDGYSDLSDAILILLRQHHVEGRGGRGWG
ncbi:hypothetical protein CEXT_43461 [Caerostris extrusa]|uniref:Uncharacterized protein n=1 Tax=Caerostris extrusa TaxID=172846 RepID=A0AAV4N3D6_CAEEX|nr:hypothetical protein CEXT_43461 [Caerostris extrusa]